MDDRDVTGSQSVDRALKLLSLVGRNSEEGMTLNQLIEASGFNKATTRRLLMALIRARLVHQDDVARRYCLGEEAYILGTLVSPKFGLVDVSRQSLIRLARESGDAAFVSVRRHTHSVCLHREDGTYPIRSHFLQKGSEHPLGIGAGSLAMLAYLDDKEVDQMIDDNSEEIARNYPTASLSDIRTGVELARNKGYAVNPGRIYADAWGLGVSIAYPDGRLAGAISIAAIGSRMQETRQRELASTLQEEATRIENKLSRMFALKSHSSPQEPGETGKMTTQRRKVKL